MSPTVSSAAAAAFAAAVAEVQVEHRPVYCALEQAKWYNM
jgi:hypothetical protein